MLNGAADGLEWSRVPGLRFKVVCTLLYLPEVTVLRSKVTVLPWYSVTILQWYNITLFSRRLNHKSYILHHSLTSSGGMDVGCLMWEV